MRSVLKEDARRLTPCTLYPLSSRNSARYAPSCPVIPVINAVLDKSSSNSSDCGPGAPTQARVCGPLGQLFKPLHIATGRYTLPTKMHAAQIRLQTASSYRPCLQSRTRTLPNINVIPACASVDFAGSIGPCESRVSGNSDSSMGHGPIPIYAARGEHTRPNVRSKGRSSAGWPACMLITLEGILLRQSRGWLCTTKYVNGLTGVRVYTLNRDDCRWDATQFLLQLILG